MSHSVHTCTYQRATVTLDADAALQTPIRGMTAGLESVIYECGNQKGEGYLL